MYILNVIQLLVKLQIYWPTWIFYTLKSLSVRTYIYNSRMEQNMQYYVNVLCKNTFIKKKILVLLIRNVDYTYIYYSSSVLLASVADSSCGRAGANAPPRPTILGKLILSAWSLMMLRTTESTSTDSERTLLKPRDSNRRSLIMGVRVSTGCVRTAVTKSPSSDIRSIRFRASKYTTVLRCRHV